MNHIKYSQAFLFLLCVMTITLLCDNSGLIDLRNRPKYDPGENIWQLAQGSNNNSSDDLKQFYDFIITQTAIGSGGELTLTEAGNYVLESDMTYTYSYAMIVTTNEIFIDMNHRKLYGSGLAEGGILVKAGAGSSKSKAKKSTRSKRTIYRPGGATLANMHKITIQNGKIDDVLGRGIEVYAVERLVLEDIEVTNADQGFYIERCEDVTLDNCASRYITQEGFYCNQCLQVFPTDILAVECNVGAYVKSTQAVDAHDCFICGITGDAFCAEDSSGIRLQDMHLLTNGSAVNLVNVEAFLLDELDSSTTTTHSYIFDNARKGVIRNCSASYASADANSFHVMNGSTQLQFTGLSATK